MSSYLNQIDIRRVRALAVLSSIFAASLLDLLGRHEWSPLSFTPIAIVAISICYLIYDECITVRLVAGTVDIPYAIVTGKPKEFADILARNYCAALKKRGVDVERIFARLRISPCDWQYHSPAEVDDQRWAELIRDIGAHFERLSRRVSREARYHVCLATPPAVALGFGAAFAQGATYTAYQYFGPDYLPVLDLGKYGGAEAYHMLHSRVSEYNELAVAREGDASARETGVILQFGGHPLSPIRGVLDSPHSEIRITHARHIGQIPSTSDWMRIAAEVSSVILWETDRQKTLHLFLGLPGSLAFVVGTAIGTYAPISVYHYDQRRQGYRRVFRLNELV